MIFKVFHNESYFVGNVENILRAINLRKKEIFYFLLIKFFFSKFIMYTKISINYCIRLIEF